MDAFIICLIFSLLNKLDFGLSAVRNSREYGSKEGGGSGMDDGGIAG